jgi:hypothetical protein
MLTGCSGAIHDFLNPVQEAPEEEITTEHRYAVNGQQAGQTDAAEETVSTTEATTETTEIAPTTLEVTEPTFSYMGTLTAPTSYAEYMYGSSPLSSVYLALKYCALDNDNYVGFAKYEGADPEKFIAELDADVLASIDTENPETQEMLVKDEEGNIVVTDEFRNNYIKTILVDAQYITSEEQLYMFYDGSYVPNGTILTTAE